MKTFFVFCLCFIPILSFGQVVDSTVLRQVDSLIAVSRKLTGERKFDEAMQVGKAAQQIAEVVFGKESAEYAGCLFNNGRICYLSKSYAEAEPLYLEAKSIRGRVLGEEHLDYAQSLNNLGYLYKDMGRYPEAKPFLIEAKAIRKKVLGTEHPIYSQSLNALGLLYWQMGRYQDAEPLYLETKDLCERVFGKEHQDYAVCLNNLGILYWQMGRYESAELFYLESKSIYEKVLGKKHPDYATCLTNLAVLYFELGRYESAELFYLESKSIYEKVLGKKHPDYATCLNNLAVLYFELGRYESAESLNLEAKAIRDKVLGKEHPDYAESVGNLARLYRQMGRYETAELFYLESQSIRKKVLGKVHSDYATSLSNLANLYRDMGRYSSAEPLYLEAKAIYEKVLGKEHLLYTSNLNGMAGLYQQMGRSEAAEPLYEEVNTIYRKLLERAAHFLSERELSSYVKLFADNLNSFYSFAQVGRGNFSVYSSGCYDNALFYKGFLLNISSRISRLAASDTAATRQTNLLKAIHRNLAKEYAKPVAERKDVEELEIKANATEKELVRTVSGFSDAIRQVNWQEVQSTLNPGEAAIEFIHYRYRIANPTDSVLYAALLLLPGDANPRLVPLFEERQLSLLLPQSNDFDRIDGFYNVKTGSAVYELIWQPLEKLLEGMATVYCSPSGLLHRLNLGAIPFSATQTFADRHRLVVLGSTRQLINQHAGTLSDSYTAVLYGGIHYDADPTVVEQDTTPLNANTLAVRGTSDIPFPYDMASRGMDAKPWKPLPATASEVQAIAALLQKQGFSTQLKTGFAATEEAFKQLGHLTPSPHLLHLSTHGYFFPDPKDASAANCGLGKAEPVFKLSDNPMIRSGLILAGANIAWTTGLPPGQGEDGILTAYEISQQNLSNTELVVLSACETGLGQIDGNEGVYGLQRAFKIAGVKYLIMSLWKVSDQATEELMTEFYRFYLDRKLPVQEAFRVAQQSMRAKYPGSPYVWAGFVLVE